MNLLKTFALVLVGFAFFSFAHPVFVYADASACEDITGSSHNLGNSGVFHFDAPYEPDAQYAACAKNLGNGTIQLQGWVWNSNLQWVSLYCGDEANDNAPPYTNLGLDCGNQKYGITVDSDDGEFHGLAWGDNTEWISFNCADDGIGCTGTNAYKVKASLEPGCMGLIYGDPSVSLPEGCSPHTYNESSAWSDSVHWFDLTGVILPFSTILVPPTPPLDAQVEVKTMPEALQVTIIDTATGNYVVDDSHPYQVTLTPVWAADTVKMDQTLPPNAPGGTGNFVDNNNGAVTKPLSDEDFTFGGSFYSASVTSKAPTSNANYYMDYNEPAFYNEIFILPPPGFTPVQPNQLILSGVKVAIKNMETGDCVLPQASGPCPDGVLYPPVNGNEYTFLPLINFSQFDAPGSKNYINLVAGTSAPFPFTPTCMAPDPAICNAATVDFSLSADAPFVLVKPQGDNGATVDDPQNFSLSYSTFNPIGDSFQLAAVCSQEACQGYGNNLSVYTTVSYPVGGQTVKYFSAKLPRVPGTLVLNPAISVKGNVYSTGITNPNTDITAVKSLGDVSTNIYRDVIFRNVSNIIAGVMTPASQTVTLSTDINGKGFKGGGVGLLKEDDGTPRVYYFRGDVVLDDQDNDPETDITWKGERTIIVVGGNVYINSSLYNPSGVAPKPKLGIIVLKDSSASPASQVSKGNVYIGPKVRNIQANIFADGSVFPYNQVSNDVSINPNGEPYFEGESDREIYLQNQLYIEGSIASWNTIGGSSAQPAPLLGNGKTESPVAGAYGSAPYGRSRARLYDLNFLRYFGLAFQRVDGNPVDQQNDPPGSPNYLESRYVLQEVNGHGGDLVLNQAGAAKGLSPNDFNAVYITSDPPTPTLPGFATQPGFNLQQRPQ